MAPPGELRVSAGVVWLAGNTVWYTPKHIRSEVLTTMRYTNRRLPLPLPMISAATKLGSVTSKYAKTKSWPLFWRVHPHSGSLCLERRCSMEAGRYQSPWIPLLSFLRARGIYRLCEVAGMPQGSMASSRHQTGCYNTELIVIIIALIIIIIIIIIIIFLKCHKVVTSEVLAAVKLVGKDYVKQKRMEKRF